jgi:hypothetical protein
MAIKKCDARPIFCAPILRHPIALPCGQCGLPSGRRTAARGRRSIAPIARNDPVPGSSPGRLTGSGGTGRTGKEAKIRRFSARDWPRDRHPHVRVCRYHWPLVGGHHDLDYVRSWNRAWRSDRCLRRRVDNWLVGS